MSTGQLAYASAFSKLRGLDTRRIDLWVERFLTRGALKSADILVDVGCGYGRFAIPLSRYVRQVIGIDASKHFLELAAQRASANTAWVCAKAEALPIAADTATVVLVSMLMEHVIEKTTLFTEVSRILSPYSTLLLRTMLPMDVHNTTWYEYVPAAAKQELARTLTLDTISSFAESAGLEIVSSDSYTDQVDVAGSSTLKERLTSRAYEILWRIPDSDLTVALDKIESLNSLVPEYLASSLVTLRRK